MKMFLAIAGAALLLATTACGSKDTTTVPGVGSVTTTDGRVEVKDAGGNNAVTVETSPDGSGANVQVQGPGGQSVSVTTGDGGAQVSATGADGTVNVQAGGHGPDDGHGHGPDDGHGHAAGSDEGEGEGHATVTVTGKEGQTTINTTTKVDESAFNVPFYPGAEVRSGGVQESQTGSVTMKIAGAELVTKDPVDKVAAFYGDKMKGANKVAASVDGQDTVTFVPANPMGGTTVSIRSEKDGTTHITLASQSQQ